jgi:hypothetical protein
MKRFGSGIFILFLAFGLCAQSVKDYTGIDARAMKVPDNALNSVDKMAAYFKTYFKTDEEKVRAVYYWVTHTMSYDMSQIYTAGYYAREQEIIDEALKSKSGVCIHYAMLFSHICNKSGVKACMITGFTRQDGKTDTRPHAWNAAFVNGTWWLFDPTWGSGSIQNGKFVRQFKEMHFNPKPEEFAQTHSPYDPAWQLLNFPFSNNAFVKGDFKINTNRKPYNFKDSIRVFEGQDSLDQQITLLRRLEKNGVVTNLLRERKNEIEKEINRMRVNESVFAFNNAVTEMNEGVGELNRFINFRNCQFKPEIPDDQLKQMLDKVDVSFEKCRNKLKGVKYTNAEVKRSLDLFMPTFNTAQQSLAEQQAFLNKYLNTTKLLRFRLFYKTIK